MSVRNAAAANGLANNVRNGCSKASPISPTGMVAAISSHARRCEDVAIWRIRSEVIRAPTILTQSRQ